MDNPFFPFVPRADTEAVRVLLRTFGGLEDFARCNAHFPRRSNLSFISFGPYKRMCLACLMQGRHVLDSEWHAFLDCPTHESARRSFAIETGIEFSCSTPSLAEDLTPLFIVVRKDIRHINQLAKFSFNIRSTRRHNFRHLSSNGLKGPYGRDKLHKRVVWERWRAGMSNPAKFVDLQFLGNAPR